MWSCLNDPLTITVKPTVAIAGAALAYLGYRQYMKGLRPKPPAKVSTSSASAPDEVCPIPNAVLLEYCASCLEKCGSTRENALLVARILVEADLRGVYSHGTNRLDLYCDELRRGAVDPKSKPVIVSDAAGVALVDGANGQGPVVGKFCMELAIKKAKETGVGWVCVRNTNHYGIAGFYAMMASELGMIGMSMTNTSPVCTPTRSKKAAIGTNPIACAAPTLSHPVVLDMATPTVPFGKVELKHRKGELCPDGWGVDKNGKATTDPAAIIYGGGVTPLGGLEVTAGYKGYGLGMMVEMLSGVLAGSKFGPRLGMSMNPNAINRVEPIDLGQCFVAIDPSKFADGYASRLDMLVGDLRGLPRADDAPGPVLVPGDPEREFTDEQMKSGVKIHRNVAGTLVRLGQVLGVEIPQEFAHVTPQKIFGGKI